MAKAKVFLFTSPTCPNCPPAKRFINEFKTQRDDFILNDFSTITPKGQKQAQKFGIRSVPTFVIQGPGYPTPIGLVGTQSAESMNKYLDISLGLREPDPEKTTLREKFREGFKIGKLRIKF